MHDRDVGRREKLSASSRERHGPGRRLPGRSKGLPGLAALAASALMVATSLPTLAQSDRHAAPVREAEATSVGRPTDVAWRQEKLPKAARGLAANDVIATPNGFLAVGGGTPDTSKPPRARIWRSDSGRSWESVPLDGRARVGMIEAVAALRSGYVAVGWKVCCTVRSYVWRSADGVTWNRLPNSTIFKGALMRDVATMGNAAFAVGCVAQFHCLNGRVWRSRNGGRTWKIISDPAFIPESVVATDRGLLAVGATSGFDDAEPVMATSADGVTWQIGSPMPPLGSYYAAGPRYQRWLAIGGTQTADRDVGRAILRRSRHDATWETISHKALRRARLFAFDHARGLTVLGGLRRRSAGLPRPFAYWTTDLARFHKDPLPVSAKQQGGEVQGVAISRNGRRVVAVGSTYDNRPAAWYGRVER